MTTLIVRLLDPGTHDLRSAGPLAGFSADKFAGTVTVADHAPIRLAHRGPAVGHIVNTWTDHEAHCGPRPPSTRTTPPPSAPPSPAPGQRPSNSEAAAEPTSALTPDAWSAPTTTPSSTDSRSVSPTPNAVTPACCHSSKTGPRGHPPPPAPAPPPAPRSLPGRWSIAPRTSPSSTSNESPPSGRLTYRPPWSTPEIPGCAGHGCAAPRTPVLPTPDRGHPAPSAPIKTPDVSDRGVFFLTPGGDTPLCPGISPRSAGNARECPENGREGPRTLREASSGPSTLRGTLAVCRHLS